MEQTLPYQILHYVLAERIAESRTGDVYKAWDSVLERFVAVKRINPELMTNTAYRAQVLSTLRELADTDHPNICSLYGVHKVDAAYVVAMELVEGESLRDRLRRGPLELEEFYRVATGIAAALNHAHLRGIVHGNLTPNNILIREDGELRVMDFGYCTLVIEREQPDAVKPVETVRYRSPEHVTGEELGQSADLFSVGAILYECLAGAPAFGGLSATVIEEGILREEPDFRRLQPDRKTPGDIVLVLKKLLAKKPSERFMSTAELVVTLTEIVSFEKASPVREFFEVAPRSPRQYLMISLLAALLIIFWLVITTVNH